MDKFKILLLDDIHKKIYQAPIDKSTAKISDDAIPFLTINKTVKQRIIGGKFSYENDDYLDSLDSFKGGVIII